MNPTIPLPETFEKGIISALQHNETSYNDCRGDKALRDALSEDLSHNFSLNFSSDCISIHPGPRAALHTALHALLDPREKRNRAVAFSPMYESFTTAPQLLTGFPAIEIPSDSACLPDLVQLKKVITTRDDIAVVVVCSPNNPTGVVYPNHVLEEIANILRPYPNIGSFSMKYFSFFFL
jgi:aspartate/methionine/tyrosine aminotransferase